jgi:CubicO group peptidase (beta-lactamase class C family)
LLHHLPPRIVTQLIMRLRLPLALSFLALGGCTNIIQLPPSAPRGLPQYFADRPPPALDPALAEARVRRVQAAVPEVASLLREELQKSQVPNAAFGLVLDDRLIHAEGLGARTDQGGAVDADTVFRIGSITKVMTGLALLILRDEGRLSLDDPAERYLPELRDAVYPTRDSPLVTLRHLVTHTSGIPRLGSLDYGDAHLVGERELLAAARGAKLDFPPGTSSKYSNLAMALAGLIVTRVSGEPVRAFLTRRLFTPLGMTSTFWEDAQVPQERLAQGHARERDGRYRACGPHWRLGPAEGMGGAYSTITDLAHFASFELAAWPPRDAPDDGPVRRATLRESQLGAGLSRAGRSTWGVNWGVSEDGAMGHVLTHNGGTEGYSSSIWLAPGKGLGVILLSSVSPVLDTIGRKALGMLAKAEKAPAPTPVALLDPR